MPQEAVGSAGQPMLMVWRPNVVSQPGLDTTPKIDAPSVFEFKPSRVKSRNAPNFSTVGF